MFEPMLGPQSCRVCRVDKESVEADRVERGSPGPVTLPSQAVGKIIARLLESCVIWEHSADTFCIPDSKKHSAAHSQIFLRSTLDLSEDLLYRILNHLSQPYRRPLIFRYLRLSDSTVSPLTSMNSRPKRPSPGFYPTAAITTPDNFPTLQGGGGNSRSTPSHQGIFQEAVRNGDACSLQRVLEELQNKVDVNSYNNDGQTALHQSCQDGNLELVKLLVQFGADVRLANRDGWSALHIAAWSGHREIAMYLINAYKR